MSNGQQGQGGADSGDFRTQDPASGGFVTQPGVSAQPTPRPGDILHQLSGAGLNAIQQFIPSQPRPYNEWAQDDFHLAGARNYPGMAPLPFMPQQQNFGPMMMGIGNYFGRGYGGLQSQLSAINAMNAYAAYIKGQQQGQLAAADLAFKKLQLETTRAIYEHGEELRAARGVLSNNDLVKDPTAVRRRLEDIAARFHDDNLAWVLKNKGVGAAVEQLQHNDMMSQDWQKLQAALDAHQAQEDAHNKATYELEREKRIGAQLEGAGTTTGTDPYVTDPNAAAQPAQPGATEPTTPPSPAPTAPAPAGGTSGADTGAGGGGSPGPAGPPGAAGDQPGAPGAQAGAPGAAPTFTTGGEPIGGPGEPPVPGPGQPAQPSVTPAPTAPAAPATPPAPAAPTTVGQRPAQPATTGPAATAAQPQPAQDTSSSLPPTMSLKPEPPTPGFRQGELGNAADAVMETGRDPYPTNGPIKEQNELNQVKNTYARRYADAKQRVIQDIASKVPPAPPGLAGTRANLDRPEVQEAIKRITAVNPNEGARLTGLLKGDIAYSRATGYGGNAQWRLTEGRVLQSLDSGWNESRFANNQRARFAFNNGQPGQQVASAATTMQHLGVVLDAFKQMGNTPFRDMNAIINNIRNRAGEAGVSEFKTALHHVFQEVTRAFRGTAGSVHDLMNEEGSIDTSASPQQILGYVKVIHDLLQGQMNTLAGRWNVNTFDNTNGRNLLAPYGATEAWDKFNDITWEGRWTAQTPTQRHAGLFADPNAYPVDMGVVPATVGTTSPEVTQTTLPPGYQ
jgi:hypothetical protein